MGRRARKVLEPAATVRMFLLILKQWVLPEFLKQEDDKARLPISKRAHWADRKSVV